MNMRKTMWLKPRLLLPSALLVSALLQGCGGDYLSDSGEESDNNNNDSATVDISNSIFTKRSGDCADYANALEASVLDISQSMGFEASMLISNTTDTCTFVSNSIPNHDFNDASAHFATPTAEYALEMSVSRSPVMAAAISPLTQQSEDAMFLNGVVLDILSAGCYDPSKSGADANGNTAIGCDDRSPWLLDPLGNEGKFGADLHNAHTQPTGQYHYHGNPRAMFDDNPGPNGSPVIGFAADGFPIFGSYFLDSETGALRKAISGFTLKTGNRIAINGLNPSEGGNSVNYDGTYVDDWEYTNAGDLDECNGMTVDGQYGYYVTDTYPWVLSCFKGTIHESFYKNGAAPTDAGDMAVNDGCPAPSTLPEPNADGSMPPPPEGCPLPEGVTLAMP